MMPANDGAADIEYMRQAIEKAKEGSETPGGAQVGCVVVKDGLVRCASFNEGELRHDPTAHAEMVSIRRLVRGARDNQSGWLHALLHAAALRHVYDGLFVDWGEPSGVWSRPE